MWNSFRTDQRMGTSGEITTYAAGNGDLIGAYVARPAGDGPFPGLVLVHHAPGWDEFYLEFAHRFANHGFVAICPNLYFRYGHGTPDDVARAALFLASEHSSWISGVTLDVAGGSVLV